MNNTSVDRAEKLTITLPKYLVTRIDSERGDIPRSRYIFRFIELAWRLKNGKEQEPINQDKNQEKNKI